MKTSFSQLAILVAVLTSGHFSLQKAHGTMLVEDFFGYTGSDPKAGGMGWAEPWQDSTPAFFWGGPGDGLRIGSRGYFDTIFSPIDGTIRIPRSGSGSRSRSFSTPISVGTVWVSLTTTFTASGFFGSGKVGFSGTGPSKIELVATSSGSDNPFTLLSPSFFGVSLPPISTPHLFSITLGAGSTDSAAVYTLDSQGAYVQRASVSGMEFGTLTGLFESSFVSSPNPNFPVLIYESYGPTAYLDDFRLGETQQEVLAAPVPEPTASLLTIIGLSAVAFCRRRLLSN